ncbi:MAG: hypothetical protein ACK52V_04730 [Betaproteobacteria bacterium]
MTILAIDPGTTESGYAVFGYGRVLSSGVMGNDELIGMLREPTAFRALGVDRIAVEMIASYGMAVGREVFETCVWIGRFIEAWKGQHELVYRQRVKLHLCQSPRAKDANIRQALIDRLGPQGTKKQPGPTYGVKSHAWAALAVAVTASDEMREAA